MFCSNFIICKIYGKIIGKHGITKFDHFSTKLLIGTLMEWKLVPYVVGYKLTAGMRLTQGLLNPIPDGDLIKDQQI